MITIHKPYIERVNSYVWLKCHIIDSEQKIDTDIWYQTDDNWGGYFIDNQADAFLILSLLPAVRYKQDIKVEAHVSEQLYYNVNNFIIPTLSAIWGGYKPRIEVSGTLSTNYHPTAVATGCSMGVDSLSSILHHTNQECLKTYRLTHLTYFNVGAMGTKNLAETENSFYNDLNKVNAFADKIGLPVVWVNSNIHQLFYNFDFNQSHTLRNMSVVLSMQKLFFRYFYASAYTIPNYKLSRDDMSHFEDPLLARLSTESTCLMSDDADLHRTEKTDYISNNKLSYDYLYVCLKEQISNNKSDDEIASLKDQHLNCSRCMKCLRTMMTLDILGKLDLYDSIFDVQYFRRIKKYYIGRILSTKKQDEFAADIYNLMCTKNYKIPAFSRVFAVCFSLRQLAPKPLYNKLLRRFRRK